MKFKQYAEGGAIYTPFISTRGTSQEQSSSSSGSKSSTKSEKVDNKIRDEIVDILQQNGLQSDVDVFLNQANSFLMKSAALSNSTLFGGENDEFSMSDLIGIQRLANSVKMQKDIWDKSVTNLTSEKAWNEVATTTNGDLYVLSENGLLTITPENFHKNSDKYRILTNSEVLGLRESDPTLAFKGHMLEDMAGVIGFTSIANQLIDVINKFGSETRGEYTKRTGLPISQSAWDGMQMLIGEGPDGYHKVTTKSERENIESAVRYLWDLLGKDGQKRMKAEIAASGGNPDNYKDRNELILRMLQHHTDFEQTPSFEKSATDYDPDGDGKGNSGSTPKYVEQTRAERYASGNGFGNSQRLPILSSDKSTPMYVSAQNLGPVLNKDEKTLFGDANLEEVLNEAYGVGGIVDRSSITFGEVPITWDDASKIMFESGSNMYRALIPAKRDGTGRLRPNFELQAKINHLNSTLQNMSAPSIKQSIADIPDVRYNETTGMIEAINVAPFIVLQGAASTDTLSSNLKDAKYLHNLTNEEDRRKKSKYNIVTGSRAVYGGGEKRQDTGNPKTTWWMGYQFFEGNVFIPINDSIIAAAVYNDQLVPQDTYINMSAKEQARQEYQQHQQVMDELLQSGNLRFNF